MGLTTWSKDRIDETICGTGNKTDCKGELPKILGEFKFASYQCTANDTKNDICGGNANEFCM